MASTDCEKNKLVRFTEGTYFVVTQVWNDPEWVARNSECKGDSKQSSSGEQKRLKSKQKR